MYPAVHARIAANGGVISRTEALDAGLSPGRIDRLVRTKVWMALRRGVYVETELWDASDPYRAQPRLRTRAALKTMRRAYVVSHDSAAHELGLDFLQPKEPLVHITRPGWTGAWTEYGVKHHLARFRTEQVLDVDGLPVLEAARTAVDLAREHGLWAGVSACDSAMRGGTSRTALEAAYEPMWCWPGVTDVRASVDLADPGAESVGESLSRIVIDELDLGAGRPQTQFPVRLPDGRVAWCDLRVGCHVFEFDGRVKYLRPEEGGVATKPTGEVVWDERRRERLICAEGLGMSRIIWADLWGESRERTKARLRAEFDETVGRFGTELPTHLAEFARRMAGRRA